MPVTVDTAMRNAAVAACVRVLTTTVASLPVDVVREEGSRRVPVVPTPSVVRSPSVQVNRRGWVAQVMKALLLEGNAYGMITQLDARAFPLSVETLPLREVSYDGRFVVAGEPVDRFPSGPLLHVPASVFLLPGSPVAQSPVEMARQSIGTGLAAEKFGAEFFGKGGLPTSVVRASQELTKEQAETLKQRIVAAWQERSPAVLGAGLEVQYPDQSAAKDSQLIELLQFEIAQAARFFGVPPTMIYAAVSGQNITYSNVVQADLQYLKHSVEIWLSDIEDAWSSMLPGPQRVKFNADALLRMDPSGRHGLYATRLTNKTMTVNEVRALEDEPPLGPEFDVPGVPAAVAPPVAPEEDDDG